MVRASVVWLALIGVLGVSACDRGGDRGPMPGEDGQGIAPAALTGADLYAERCATCHGHTGLGDGPAGAAIEPGDLTTAEMQERLTDDQIAEIIRMGRGRMPPSGVSDEAELRALVEHVRTLRR